MGLDMYLYLRKYEGCSQYDDDYEEKKDGFYPQELKVFADEIINRNFMSKSTAYQVGYWRKANHIHKWFVDVCAQGVDECQEIYVSVEDAKELRNLCNCVLNQHELAPKLLPVSDGFFFGSQEYDEGYFWDVEYTRDLLDKLIAFVEENHCYEIIYEASW